MNVPAELRYSSGPRVGPPGRGCGHDRHHRVRPGLARRHRVRAGARHADDVVKAGESFAEVESTKSVRDIYAPVVRHRSRRSTRRWPTAPKCSTRTRTATGGSAPSDVRPGRVRRAARCRRLPGAHRGLSVAPWRRLLQSVRPSQPADECVLLELWLAARLAQERPHGHADRGRSAAGRARARTTTSRSRSATSHRGRGPHRARRRPGRGALPARRARDASRAASRQRDQPRRHHRVAPPRRDRAHRGGLRRHAMPDRSTAPT